MSIVIGTKDKNHTAYAPIVNDISNKQSSQSNGCVMNVVEGNTSRYYCLCRILMFQDLCEKSDRLQAGKWDAQEVCSVQSV